MTKFLTKNIGAGLLMFLGFYLVDNSTITAFDAYTFGVFTGIWSLNFMNKVDPQCS